MSTYEILSLLFFGGNFLIALLAYIVLGRSQVGLLPNVEVNHFVGGCSLPYV